MIMSNRELVLELVEDLLRIENEKKLLQQEQKELYEEYKERLDVKAVKAAIQIAKIRARLGDSETEVDRIMETVESKISV
jgi:uncharacterized protein (UPF0335 family)